LKNIGGDGFVTMIDVLGLNQPDIIAQIGEALNIHPLSLEDILDTSHPMKIEFYDNYIFTILKLLNYDETSKSVNIEHIGIVLGNGFVAVFQEIEDDTFSAVKERIVSGKGKIIRSGADYLFYSLIDFIVDNYLHELDKISDDIEVIEDELISNPQPSIAKKIHSLKTTLIELKKSFKPLASIVRTIEIEETTLLQKETYLYFRDLYDHIGNVLDMLESNREILTSLLEIFMTANSQKLNEVMKVLTIIATIFIPLTFIAGIYGMNFRFMPELEWRWGYPMILAFMFALGLYMLYYFKRKKWF
jgi:magnesium transporter